MNLSVTLVIIIVTVIISMLAFGNQRLQDKLIFYPPAVSQNRQWYRFFTCGFIHADTGHLIFNMLSLFFFGEGVEKKFTEIFQENGSWLYLLLYISALFFSLLPTYLKHKEDRYYKSLGASGAVSAVLFAAFLLEPTIGVMIMFIPIPIPAFIFGPLYLLISTYLDKKGKDNINHSAHIFGALYGIAFVIIATQLVGFNAIDEFVTGVKQYLSEKGWIK
jgi:membrane associated rhomboid family serine protease